MTELLADLSGHHIEGYARAAIEAGKPGHFSAPLISHITGNLYVGGCRNGVRLPDDFRSVFSLYKWERYELGPDTTRLEVEMYDSSDVPDHGQIFMIARSGSMRRWNRARRWCTARLGLNRSNLIAASALILQGMAPADAIALLREKRSPVVLCNEAFEAWLLEQAA